MWAVIKLRDSLLTCVCSNCDGLLKGEVVFQLPKNAVHVGDCLDHS